jgi:hypothetical protein
MRKIQLFFLGLLVPFLCKAQDSLQFLSATTGAACYVTAYHNNYLYTGTGSTFRVYDVHSIETPPYDVKFEHRFTSIINEIEIIGDTAYICANHAGLSKWDISQPLSPQKIWEWIPTGLEQACYDISFNGDSLFIANRSRVTLLRDNGSSVSFLQDFAVQTNPLVRIMGGDVKDNLYAFTISTMFLFPSALLDGVHIYDATTLTELSFHFEQFGDHEDVLFGQNTDLLHVLAGTDATSTLSQEGHFYTLNVADPANPFPIFHDTLAVHPIFGFGQGQALNAEIRNDTVFLVTKSAEDSIVNILDPPNGNIYVYDGTNNAVSAITVIDAGLWYFDLALQNNLLHVASEWFGIRTIDISNIFNDVHIGDTPTGGWNITSATYGNKMVLANEGYGLKLFDISDPMNPILTHEHINISNGFCFGVQFSDDGNYIYASYFTANDGLRVFDNTLTQVGSLSDFTGYERMRLWQDKIVAHGQVPFSPHKLFVVDISNATSPTLQTSWPQEAYDLWINENGMLFMSTKDSLTIMDLSNNMQTLNTIYDSGAEEFQAMAMYKDTLYVNVKNKGLVRYFHNPTTHALTEDITVNFPEGDAKWLAADSLGLYVGFQQHGVHAYNRTTLTFVDSYEGGRDFTHPNLWGMEDLKAENGLVILVEYFEQTTLLKFENGSLTAIETPELNPQSITIYPNPTTLFVNIVTTGNSPITAIEVYNPEGRLIMTESNLKTKNFQLNSSELPPGFYLINIHTKKGVITRKLMIQ